MNDIGEKVQIAALKFQSLWEDYSSIMKKKKKVDFIGTKESILAIDSLVYENYLGLEDVDEISLLIGQIFVVNDFLEWKTIDGECWLVDFEEKINHIHFAVCPKYWIKSFMISNLGDEVILNSYESMLVFIVTHWSYQRNLIEIVGVRKLHKCENTYQGYLNSSKQLIDELTE